jgi:hypothetical protein
MCHLPYYVYIVERIIHLISYYVKLIVFARHRLHRRMSMVPVCRGRRFCQMSVDELLRDGRRENATADFGSSCATEPGRGEHTCKRLHARPQNRPIFKLAIGTHNVLYVSASCRGSAYRGVRHPSVQRGQAQDCVMLKNHCSLLSRAHAPDSHFSQ